MLHNVLSFGKSWMKGNEESQTFLICVVRIAFPLRNKGDEQVIYRAELSN